MAEILHVPYPEWYINIENPPKEGDYNYDVFWEKQERLCKEGCTVGGVFINPYLYWHLNFWRTEVDYKDDNGKPQQSYTQPHLRDNEWEFFNGIWEAEKQQKGLAVGGIRRFGKSVGEASFIAHGATFDKDSQNVIAGLNSPDIKLITDKIDKGLNHLPPYFQWMRLEDNWNKGVTLGVKSRDGRKFPFSQILIRNLDNGNNEETIAGTKPRKLIIDESLDKDELVYTEGGFKTIEFVEVGDKIYGDDGCLTTVLEKVNPGIVPTYKITLADGREVISSENHIWRVWNTYLKREVEVTTRELNSKYYFNKRDNRYDKTIKSFIYSIPHNKCLDFKEQELPVDPYYLGCWLGDGMTNHTNFVCNMDKEVINSIKDYAKSLGLEYLESFHKGENKHPDFRYMRISNGKGKVNPLIESMRTLNLEGNKHIPEIYKRSSKQQRLELIRGVFDTDGSIYKNGSIEVTSSIKKLAYDLAEICRSVGISVRLVSGPSSYKKYGIKHECKTSYSLQIKTTEDVFKIERKRKRYRPDTGSRNDLKKKHNRKYTTIVDVTPSGDRQSYCIRVDNDSKLFLTTNFVVTHNCAKGSFLKGLQAAMPGFTTPYGWTCSPVCTFTGGDASSFHDAKELMMNPDAYNFLSFPHKDKPQVKHGLFFNAKYRLEGKVNSTLAELLNEPDNEELKQIPIQISDEEKSMQVTESIIEQRRLSGDTDSYLKEVMYYPVNVEDIFVSRSTNFFNKEAIKKQIQHIEDNRIQGLFVELFNDGEKIQWKHSEKKPIPEYPTPKGCNTDAPIVIWDQPSPKDDKYWFTFVGGLDSYVKEGTTVHSDSLGALYIFKRMVNVTGDGFQDMLVASYVARPESKDYFQDQCRLLIKYYNAFTLVENDELSFIDYMKHKNDAQRYLAPSPAWTKAVTPYSTQKASFGMSRSSDKIQSLLENMAKGYLDEVVSIEKDQDGSVVREVLGVTRIFDKPLLQEFLTYERGRNADRYVAFTLALCQANDIDITINPNNKEKNDNLIKSLYEQKAGRRTFSKGVKNSLMNKKKPKRFR